MATCGEVLVELLGLYGIDTVFGIPGVHTVELELAVPILVWNNRGYGEIKKYMVERGIPQIGVDIYTPDFLTIAQGFGCRAVKAESLTHLQEQLRQAHRAGGPTLIQIDEAAALGW